MHLKRTADPRAVGDRPRDALSVDVAQILQRQPCSSKRDIEFCNRGASEDSNQPSVVVDVGQPAQPVKAEQQAVRGSNVVE